MFIVSWPDAYYCGEGGSYLIFLPVCDKGKGRHCGLVTKYAITLKYSVNGIKNGNFGVKMGLCKM